MAKACGCAGCNGGVALPNYSEEYMRECEARGIARMTEGRHGEWLHEFWKLAKQKRSEAAVADLINRVNRICDERSNRYRESAAEVARRLGVAA